jgi:hypothetical protein
MQFDKDLGRLVRGLVCALALVLLAGIASVKAADPDALAKKIEQTLSGVQRRVATEPSRAETELLEARSLLTQLKEAAPNHAKLAALVKQADDLATKLERRLGRPVGGSAEKKEETKPADTPKPNTPSDLPSAVVTQFKRLEDTLNAVVAALEKNQLQTATTRMDQAKKLMAEIQSRYGSRIPAGNAEFKAATDRLTAVEARHTQAKSAADAAAAAAAVAQQHQETQSKEWLARFAPFFDIKSDQYLLMGSSLNTASEADQEKCRQAYAKANDLMAAYKKTEFPHGKTQALMFEEQRLAGRLAIYNEGAARAQQEEACRPWVEKLRPYVEVGAGSPKYLIDGVTLSESDIQERAALLAEAQALWPEYEKAEFPLGKTTELLSLEETMQQRLRDMPETLQRSRALVSADAEKEFDRILVYLNQDTGWKTDLTKKPNLVMERDVTPLQQAIERYAGTVAPDDAKLATLKQKLGQIKEQDAKNRAVRAERTYMTADRFTGDNADELRRKVEEVVKTGSNGAKPLRVTLPAEDWREESVIEWTDTTHTALRHRITRYMTAQAAAKAADGKVYLHGVHLANDRQSDGSWGPLQGHIVWSDWMAEANVNKEPPTP